MRAVGEQGRIEHQPLRQCEPTRGGAAVKPGGNANDAEAGWIAAAGGTLQR